MYTERPRRIELNLGVHNMCLLIKWLFKLLNGDGV